MSNIKKISLQNNKIRNCNPERLSLLEKSLRLTHLNKAEYEKIIETCIEFNHIFYLEGDELTSMDAIQHNIPTTSNAPIHTKTYRYPEAHKAEVNQQITKVLDQNIIRPSNSPWYSPVWVVPKKQDASGKQKWRLVIDYRKLNEISIGDSYPLPNISELLDQLGHSKYFTTLDLASGFHQIKIEKTAFTVPPLGYYEFTRMPFGLKKRFRNVPTTNEYNFVRFTRY